MSLGKGDESFEVDTSYVAGVSPQRLGLGDLDGDGFPDLVAAHPLVRQIAVFLNDGAGHLGAGTITRVPRRVADLAVGHMD